MGSAIWPPNVRLISYIFNAGNEMFTHADPGLGSVILLRDPFVLLATPGSQGERARPTRPAAVAPLVAEGHGIGLVPRSAVDPSKLELISVPTAGLIAPRRVKLGWHVGRRTPRIEAFCDAAARAFLNERRRRRRVRGV